MAFRVYTVTPNCDKPIHSCSYVCDLSDGQIRPTKYRFVAQKYSRSLSLFRKIRLANEFLASTSKNQGSFYTTRCHKRYSQKVCRYSTQTHHTHTHTQRERERERETDRPDGGTYVRKLRAKYHR